MSICVIVKPVFDVVEDADFNVEGLLTQNTGTETRNVEYCYECGSPLFYIKHICKKEEDKIILSSEWYCAVCGSYQGGVDTVENFDTKIWSPENCINYGISSMCKYSQLKIEDYCKDCPLKSNVEE